MRCAERVRPKPAPWRTPPADPLVTEALADLRDRCFSPQAGKFRTALAERCAKLVAMLYGLEPPDGFPGTQADALVAAADALNQLLRRNHWVWSADIAEDAVPTGRPLADYLLDLHRALLRDFKAELAEALYCRGRLP
jgi:hypothetical protein